MNFDHNFNSLVFQPLVEKLLDCAHSVNVPLLFPGNKA